MMLGTSNDINKTKLKMILARTIEICGAITILWFLFIQLYIITGTKKSIPSISIQMIIFIIGTLEFLFGFLMVKIEDAHTYKI